jgi:hypothetical protein
MLFYKHLEIDSTVLSLIRRLRNLSQIFFVKNSFKFPFHFSCLFLEKKNIQDINRLNEYKMEKHHCQ